MPFHRQSVSAPVTWRHIHSSLLDNKWGIAPENLDYLYLLCTSVSQITDEDGAHAKLNYPPTSLPILGTINGFSVQHLGMRPIKSSWGLTYLVCTGLWLHENNANLSTSRRASPSITFRNLCIDDGMSVRWLSLGLRMIKWAFGSLVKCRVWSRRWIEERNLVFLS